MSESLRFDNKVVIVTGAGGSLGRAYALEFARRGAKVVVNDYGGNMKGAGHSRSAGNATIELIQAFGGVCVGNYDSVEDGQSLVKTAIDAYGRIDILVNNAGILRDRSFQNISDNDWDIIQRIHLKGSFAVTRAAWPFMKKQKFGRIIMTASPGGLYGNFGQANYTSAKMGCLGLANTLAVEGYKYNIRVNTIFPTAFSRMTEGILPKELLNQMNPETVVPLVIVLSHESFNDTASMYEATGGCFTKVTYSKGAGLSLTEKDLSPEKLMANFNKVKDNRINVVHNSIAQQVGDSLGKVKQAGVDEILKDLRINKGDPRKSVGLKIKGLKNSYTTQDTILYALSVGVNSSDITNLPFVYEMSPKFSVLPGFMSSLSLKIAFQAEMAHHLQETVHSDHYLELFKPIPREANVCVETECVDVVDKTKSAIYIVKGEMTELTPSGKSVKLAAFTNTSFVRGRGGFGGKATSSHLCPTVDTPTRPYDARIVEATSDSQAAIYRLNGDDNPLHIDPKIAGKFGFKQPILHGLCTVGIAIKTIMSRFANNDMSLFKAVQVRFTSIVLPGQHIQTTMWKQGTKIIFTCTVVETQSVCIKNAFVQLAREPDADFIAICAKNESIMRAIGDRLSKYKEILVQAVNSVFVVKLYNDNTTLTYTLDAKNEVKVYEGLPFSGQRADLSLSLPMNRLALFAEKKVSMDNELFSGNVKLLHGEMIKLANFSKLFADTAKL